MMRMVMTMIFTRLIIVTSVEPIDRNDSKVASLGVSMTLM